MLITGLALYPKHTSKVEDLQLELSKMGTTYHISFFSVVRTRIKLTKHFKKSMTSLSRLMVSPKEKVNSFKNSERFLIVSYNSCQYKANSYTGTQSVNTTLSNKHLTEKVVLDKAVG